MKAALSLGLVLTVTTFGSLSVSGTAYAVNANISGTACRNYNAGEANDIDYVTQGARNASASPRAVICPIVRSPTTTNAVSVYVDGFAATGQTIFCELLSFDYTGKFLGYQAFSAGRTGTFDVFLTVPGSYWGNASVLCTLPPNFQGLLYNVDVVQ